MQKGFDGNMKDKTSIKRKISSLIMRISLVSVMVVGIITISAMWILRDTINNVSGELGDKAANDSEEALKGMARERLLTLAKNKAALSDEKLKDMQSMTEMIAYHANDIMENKRQYNPNPVAAPNMKNKGVLAAQFLRPENVPLSKIEKELDLMGNIQKILINIVKNNANVTSAYIGTESGCFIIADEDSDKRIGQFFETRERPWYKEAKESDKLIWTDIYSDAYGRGLSINCAKPYYDKSGSMAGVVSIGSLLGELTNIVLDTKVGETGYAFMLSEKGEIIISESIREDDLNGENTELAGVARNMAEGKSGITTFGKDGKDWFIAYAPLETLHWSLATVMEVDEVVAPANHSKAGILSMKQKALSDINMVMITVIVIFAIVLAVIVLVIGYSTTKFTKSLTKPILMLQEGVRQIASGDLSHPIDVHTRDEIEDLGTSVNKMAEDIKEYVANLEKATLEKERIGAELDVARVIQKSMVPSAFPAFPERMDFDVFAILKTAKEIGGDFYDFFLVDETHFCMVIASVTGRGIPAALFLVVARTLIKNYAQMGLRPDKVFAETNNRLCENNETNLFVTAFLGILDLHNGRFRYVNADHPVPFVKRGGKGIESLGVQGSFVLAGLEGVPYDTQETALMQGDTLFFYTEGVEKRMNRESLVKELNQLIGKEYELEGIVTGIERKLMESNQGEELTEDVTMMGFRYYGV